MGEVLCIGFNLVVLNPSDGKGHDPYSIVAIKDKKMRFIHIDWIYPSTSYVILLKALLRSC